MDDVLYACSGHGGPGDDRGSAILLLTAMQHGRRLASVLRVSSAKLELDRTPHRNAAAEAKERKERLGIPPPGGAGA